MPVPCLASDDPIVTFHAPPKTRSKRALTTAAAAVTASGECDDTQLTQQVEDVLEDRRLCRAIGCKLTSMVAAQVASFL